ncbi:MAG: hypothetical protein J1E40_02100, partial [Oscillospiraceae bacterium]|nr:hypothetical protein [Oscillospiraceae bacterium]
TVTTADASETKAVVISENRIVDGVILPPDEDFLRSVSSGDKGRDNTIVFTLDSSGKYSSYDADMFYNNIDSQMMQDFAKEMLSEEYYEENKEYLDVSSYEEYISVVEEYLGDELRGYLEYEPEETKPLAYFSISVNKYIDEGETAAYTDEDVFYRTAEWLFKSMDKEPEVAEKIIGCFESGESFYSSTVVYYEGKDFIKVYAGFADSTNDYSDGEFFCDIEEEISVDGRDGIVLNGTFVPADTEKLLLTHRNNKDSVELIAEEIIPEDCFMVCFEKYSEYAPDYDLKAVSEKLPNLRELYLYSVKVTNTECIAEMQGLETLCYNASVSSSDGHYSAAVDAPFKDLPKLKNLWLDGDYTDYSFLNDMPGLESVFISLKWMSGAVVPYDSISDCSVITGLEIEVYNDLTGLEKLTNLQHLHLTNGWGRVNDTMDILDLSVVKELKNLTCLEISASGYDIGELSDLIGNPSKLEKLKLTAVKTTKDWSFLSQLTSLKTLDLLDVRNISSKDIDQIPSLENLKWL